MDLSTLGQLTELPETHRLIVGNYDGAYTLGVTDQPLGFVLRVEAGDTSRFPEKVLLRGHIIPVTVTGGFGRPVPTTASR